MTKFQNCYFTMPDGTLKHINPLTGTEVWTVPDRAHRPLYNRALKPPKPLLKTPKENFCDFCESEYFRTPPEKARLTKTDNGQYQKMEKLSPDLIEASHALFRRVANLFEIVTIDYWIKNHGFQFTLAQAQWKKSYLENAKGLEHVLQITDSKLKLTGKTLEEISNIPQAEKIKLADAFFGGAHELIIYGHHFKPGAQWDN
ncbi:MAG TPA: DUF4921 family protein, partial [bacterium]